MQISARNASIIRAGLEAGYHGDSGALVAVPRLFTRAYKRGLIRRMRDNIRISQARNDSVSQAWKDLSERYSNMKQIKVIFKSGADITIWVKSYSVGYTNDRLFIDHVPAEGHPEIKALDSTEIAAVLELS